MSGSGSSPPSGSVAPPLIGRSGELDQLRQWLTEALGGSPRVVVLTGDEGIGKSRLVGELISEARAAGVRPFAGRCLQDSTVPLLPLAALLDALRSDVPTYAAIGAGATLGDSEQSVAVVASTVRALMAAAADRPVLLVLDDAQWADQATIDLVAHLEATLAHEAVFRELPVMLLVTARPTGAAPAARRLLSRLTRDAIGRTLRLGGLDDLGLFALLHAATGVRPSTGLLSLARDVTSGNPLEVESLLSRLARAEALERRGRELATIIEDPSELPPELDVDIEVVAQLDELTEPGRRLLTTLVLLRDGRMATLGAAADLTSVELDAALDEVAEAGLVTEDGVRIDFADNSIARAAADCIGTRRRPRLHAEIARRLSRADPTPFVVSEIADQLIRAGTAADLELLAACAGEAGDEALRVGAWADAQRHYGAALEQTALDDEARARLELRAAIAAHRNLDRVESSAHAERAIDLARRSGDFRTWGEASLLGSRAASDAHLLDQFLSEAGEREPALRARAHATLSELSFDRLQLDVAAAHAEDATRIAQETDDPAAAARIEFVVGLQRFGSLDLDAATHSFERCRAHARRIHDPLLESWAAGRCPLVLWSRGELGDAAEAAAVVADTNRASGWWSEYSLVTSARAGIAVAQGNLGAAERFGCEAAAAHGRSEQPGVAAMLWSALANGRTLLGDIDGAHAAIDKWEEEDPYAAFLFRALVDALLAPSPEATSAGDFPSLVAAGGRVDLTSLSLACLSVEIADALDRPEIAANALEVLVEAYRRGTRFTPGWSCFVPRLAGVACFVAGSFDEAERWLRVASTDARASQAPGELARIGYDLARIRLASGGDAGPSLTEAITGFEHLGFRPLLRAARHLAGWPESRSEADSGATRVIMVTDIVDSTPLTRRVGDRRFVELLREHNRIVRTRLRQFDGVEFKHTGDGIAAWFLTAGAAVECSLHIQEDLERANRRRAHDPVVIRIGIAAGEVVKDESDVYGLAVITAFRVCDLAGAGRVLVSEELTTLARHTGLGFVAAGEVVLKGFSDSQPLFEVVRAS